MLNSGKGLSLRRSLPAGRQACDRARRDLKENLGNNNL